MEEAKVAAPPEGAPFRLWVHLFKSGSDTQIGEGSVTISATNHVEQLRKAVQEKWKNSLLQDCDAATLVVKPTRDGEPLTALRTRLSAVKFECDTSDGSLHVSVYLPTKPEKATGPRSQLSQLPLPWQVFGGKADMMPWKRDTSASAYITELLEAHQKEIQCEAGSLAVIEMKNGLQRDEFRSGRTLVVPSGTRGAWKALLDAVEKDSSDQRFLVIGTPGVGKSRTLNYLIREIILGHRKKAAKPPAIVFEHPNDGLVWLFIPTEPENPLSVYEPYSTLAKKFAAGTGVLYNPRNYYILDSTPARGMPALVPATTIFLCPPDARHFSEYKKHIYGRTYFIPCWKKQEIFAAVPYILEESNKRESFGVADANELLNIVKARTDIVGPIPRRVFGHPNEFADYKSQLDISLKRCDVLITDILNYGVGTLMADQSAGNTVSSVFLINVDEDQEEEDGKVIQNEDGEVIQKPNYQSQRVQFVSDYARENLGMATLLRMWDEMFNVLKAPSRDSALRREFERIFWCLIRNGLELPIETIPSTGPPQQMTLRVKKGDQEVPNGPGFFKRVFQAMGAMKTVQDIDGEISPQSPPIYLGINFPGLNIAAGRNLGFRVTFEDGEDPIEEQVIQNIRGGVGLNDGELLHIVHITPENLVQSKAKQKLLRPFQAPNLVRNYHAIMPSPHSNPQIWTRFLHRQFSTLRRVSRLMHK